MTNSSVPATIRAIIAALAANLPSTVPIYAGQGATDTIEQSYVLVGVQDADDTGYSMAVTGSQVWAQLGGLRRDEVFTVHCVAVSWNGNEGTLAAMDGAYALMAGIETALTMDPTLNGSVLFSLGISSMGMRWAQDNQGAIVHLPFDVECKSRI